MKKYCEELRKKCKCLKIIEGERWLGLDAGWEWWMERKKGVEGGITW